MKSCEFSCNLVVSLIDRRGSSRTDLLFGVINVGTPKTRSPSEKESAHCRGRCDIRHWNGFYTNGKICPHTLISKSNLHSLGEAQ